MGLGFEEPEELLGLDPEELLEPVFIGLDEPEFTKVFEVPVAAAAI